MATQLAERRDNPVAVFRQNLDRMADQLKMALPAHISVEKFQRVATTAVQTNPGLLDGSKVDRTSLFGALVRAAQDGLLPDGREGAIVPFKGKAMWLPMVAGVMKKVRNSGEIADWNAHAVYENDEFDYLLGDDQRIYHKPTMDEPGKVIGAYSIVKLKDGTISRDFMPRWRIEKARQQGSAKDSLQWTTFYDEGAIKTVIKHHAKRLPQSTDIDAVFERDEGMGAGRIGPSIAAISEPIAQPALASRLDALEHQIDDDVTPSADEPDSRRAIADEAIAAIKDATNDEQIEAVEQWQHVVALPEDLRAEIAAAKAARRAALAGEGE